MKISPIQATPDSIIAELDDVFRAPEYVWVEIRDPWAWIRRLVDSVASWFGVLYQDHPVIYVVLLATLIIVLTAIFVHFAFLIFQALKPRAPLDDRVSGGGIIRDAAWYRKEAARLETRGKLAASLVMRFSALVLELDRRQLVAFRASKTPIEYVREAQLTADGRDRFGMLAERLYEHVYGGRQVTAAALHAFDRDALALLGSNVA